MFNIELMKQRVIDISDSNIDYTQDDFNAEFSVNLFDEVTLDHKIGINFVNTSENSDPEYATDGASGFDIRSNETTVLKAKEFKAIGTGLYFEIPDNFEIQIRSRSGLSIKHGVVVLNSPGTIDSDFLGEIKVILINHSDIDFTIEKGDRIAQAVISTVLSLRTITLKKITEITKITDRNIGGFGSTGIK